MLDEAATAVDMTSDDIGLLLNWRYGPLGEAIDDLSFITQAHTFTGLGLRPYSPVHLQGKRDPVTGDWTFIWIRRTGSTATAGSRRTYPCRKRPSAYTLEILDGLGGNVVRTVTGIGAEAYLYAVADQTTDFGSPQWNVAIRVTQISAGYGAGAPAEALTYDYQH